MKLQEIVVSNTTSDIGEEADTNNSIGNSEEKIQHSRNITERSKEKCIILAINYIHRKMQKSKQMERMNVNSNVSINVLKI